MPALPLVLPLAALACAPGEDPAAPVERGPNRLVHEESAYLRQHATNPVDWYPWGAEAFSKAAEEGKPIFLSIGYSTCHWCHVMERESFEDEEVAAVLNEHFVPIKVDREERPDVDSIYMTFVQARTGSGGWPLNVFLTPERVPFFGGTYFPPERLRGMPSFREVLERVVEVWESDRDAIERDAETVARFLRERSAAPDTEGALDASILDGTVSAFAERFDETWGGTAGAPKFPAPRALQLLLRHEHRTGSERALEMVLTTLDRMAAGGIHDQLGGGFSRYAVDARWLVPHFEKMLYDNAQLARVYAEAHQRTGAPRFAAVARGVLDYLLRDMRLEGGAFAAAEDADSEGEEGRFYTWTPDEVRAVLGDEAAAAALAYYGVTGDGHLDGRSVLHVADPKALAGDALEAVRRRLLEARASRARPLRDDKVLAGWNGLAISAFAYAGRALDEPRYVAAARDAAVFLLERLDLEDGLRRRLAGGEAEIHGHLSDHAFLAQGLLDLYESDLDPRWLDAALDLTDRATENFLDPESGTFFDVPAGRDDLLVRPRDAADGAVPSGTAVHVKNLLRLAELTMDDARRTAATRCLEAYAGEMARVGLAYVELVNALGVALAPPREIVFAGRRGAEDVEALIRAYWSAFRPYRVIAHAPADPAARAAVAERLPLVEGRTPVDGAAAVYLCEDYACRLPITDPAELE